MLPQGGHASGRLAMLVCRPAAVASWAMDVALVFSAVGAAAAVVSAGVAARSARQSRVSALQANAASAAIAAIEQDRRQGELTPRFRVTAESANPGIDDLKLRVMLAGPPGLDRVDTLTVRIRNDHHQRGQGPHIAGGPDPAEVEAFVWSPYKFSHGTRPAD